MTENPEIIAMKQVQDSQETLETIPSTIPIPMTPILFITTISCLSLSMFLIVLDTAMISTAIPSIIQEFKNISQIGWIGSGYLLGSTAFSPLFGSFSDIFGRKPSFLMALFLFELCCFVCGSSLSMNMLLCGRFLAGIGRSGIFALTLIMVSDISSLRDRGKYQGMIGAVYGIASLVGPFIGGSFVDKVS
jgi:MFS family permease